MVIFCKFEKENQVVFVYGDVIDIDVKFFKISKDLIK